MAASLITLTSVNRSDYRFLYELLLQRRPVVNISHKRMPTFEEHLKFIKSRPYSVWYIISYKRKKIGAIYLSRQNEIGIHLMKRHERRFIYLESIKKLMMQNPRGRYLANVSPRNKKYIKYFKEIGFRLIQHTYERDERHVI